MTRLSQVRGEVLPAGGGAPNDYEAIAESALALGHELAELDVEEVVPVTGGEAPAEAKGPDAAGG